MKRWMVVAVLSLVFSSTGCQSYIVQGDKDSAAISKSIGAFRDQIASYSDKVRDMRERNRQIAEMLTRRSLPDSLELVTEVQANRAKIALYEGKISVLENQVDGFLSRSAGKEATINISLQGCAEEVADAYAIIATSGMATNQISADSLKGIVINDWYNEVTAKVEGPGNFVRVFNLPPRSRSIVFSLPAYGRYRTTFSTGRESKSTERKVGPNIVFYDAQNRSYDYMALLPAR